MHIAGGFVQHGNQFFGHKTSFRGVDVKIVCDHTTYPLSHLASVPPPTDLRISNFLQILLYSSTHSNKVCNS